MKKFLLPTIATCVIVAFGTSYTASTSYANDMSNKLLNKEGSSYHNTHKGYLENLRDRGMFDKAIEIINNVNNSYKFFTLTGNSVRVRTGPGTNYPTAHLAYKDIPEEHEFPGDMPMSVLGGIVGNTLYSGNEDCSAWKEVLAVNMTTSHNGSFLLGSAGDSADSRYICVDFIETSPLTPYVDEWVDVQFRAEKVADENNEKFSKPVTIGNDVTLVDYLYNKYNLKAGEQIVFSNDFYDGMLDEEFFVLKLIDGYAFRMQTTTAKELQKKVKLNADGKKALDDFIVKNKRLQ